MSEQEIIRGLCCMCGDIEYLESFSDGDICGFCMNDLGIDN